MVWSPSAPGGYPWPDQPYAAVKGGKAYSSMDTTGDGVVDQSDDPFEPFYPGECGRGVHLVGRGEGHGG